MGWWTLFVAHVELVIVMKCERLRLMAEGPAVGEVLRVGLKFLQALQLQLYCLRKCHGSGQYIPHTDHLHLQRVEDLQCPENHVLSLVLWIVMYRRH